MKTRACFALWAAAALVSASCGSVQSEGQPDAGETSGPDSSTVEAPDASGATFCGDLICQPAAQEDCVSCPGDCGACPSECGDGELDPGEECDDGNTNSGDGCSQDCLVEGPPGSRTFHISGVITYVDDPGGVFGGEIAVGEPFSGRYTYDPATADTNSDPTVGDYWHYSPGYGLTVDVEGWTFQTDPNNTEYLFEVVDRMTDQMVMHSYQNVSLPGVTGVGIVSWQLDGTSGGIFSGDAIWLACPDLGQYEQAFGLTIDGNIGGDLWFVRGVVDTCM